MSKNPRLFPESLPFWLVNMSDKSCMSARDVADLFGFKNAKVVAAQVAQGSFPKPDSYIGVNRGGLHKQTLRWNKSTILKEIERRKKLSEPNTVEVVRDE